MKVAQCPALWRCIKPRKNIRPEFHEAGALCVRRGRAVKRRPIPVQQQLNFDLQRALIHEWQFVSGAIGQRHGSRRRRFAQFNKRIDSAPPERRLIFAGQHFAPENGVTEIFDDKQSACKVVRMNFWCREPLCAQRGIDGNKRAHVFR